MLIGKVEYIKCAGLLSTLVNEPYIDVDVSEELYNYFEESYRYNAQSVAEQYDEECSIDEKDYRKEFNEAIEVAKKYISQDPDVNKMNLLSGILHFMRSVLYQIENQEMCAWVGYQFVYYTGKAIENMAQDKIEWWCGIDLVDLQKTE